MIRGFLVLGLLSVFAWRLYSNSRAQDASGDIRYTSIAERWSAPGVIVLFLGGSLLSYDWIMSLDPHWFSTMFGVIFLTGGALSFMATLIVVCLWLRSAGYLADGRHEEGCRTRRRPQPSVEEEAEGEPEPA